MYLLIGVVPNVPPDLELREGCVVSVPVPSYDPTGDQSVTCEPQVRSDLLTTPYEPPLTNTLNT